MKNTLYAILAIAAVIAIAFAWNNEKQEEELADPFYARSSLYDRAIARERQEFINGYRSFIESVIFNLSDEEKRYLINFFNSSIYEFDRIQDYFIELYGNSFYYYNNDEDACLSSDIIENATRQLICISNFVIYSSDINAPNLPLACWERPDEFGQRYRIIVSGSTPVEGAQYQCGRALEQIDGYYDNTVFAGRLLPYHGEFPAIILNINEGRLEISVDNIVYRQTPSPPPPPLHIFNESLGDLYNQMELALRDGTRRNYIITQDLLYCRESTSQIILIPAGFVTDLLSVPHFARILDDERTYTGAVVHDWLFALGGSEYDRIIAEQIFVEELKYTSSGPLRTFAISVGTGILGPRYYRWFGRNSPFGRADEMRFATPDSCQRASSMRSRRERVFIRTDMGCDGFQDNYHSYHALYASSEIIDIDYILNNDDARRYFLQVIENVDESKSCLDLIE